MESAYKRLVLRNNGTDKAVTLFREELFQTLISQIEGVDSKSVAPIAVYLNGVYYNCEWMQEVYDRSLYGGQLWGLPVTAIMRL